MRIHGVIEKIGSIGAFLAASACPVCFPMLAVVGSIVGLGILKPFEGIVFILFQFFVFLALIGNILSFMNHRNVLALLIGIAGPVLILFALYVKFINAVLYVGLFGLLASLVANFIANRRCKSCELEHKN